MPANTTSILQPLDQGIIKNFKSFYRKEIINQILLDIESDGKPTNINILHAIRMIDKSWRKVKKETIVNCFLKSGFFNTEVQSHYTANEIIEPEIQWPQIKIALQLEDCITLEDYIQVDSQVSVTGFSTDQEIVNDIKKGREEEEDDDDSGSEDDMQETPITNFQVTEAIRTIRHFLERVDYYEDEYSALHKIEVCIDRNMQKKLCQKKMTDYFNFNSTVMLNLIIILLFFYMLFC